MTKQRARRAWSCVRVRPAPPPPCSCDRPRRPPVKSVHTALRTCAALHAIVGSRGNCSCSCRHVYASDGAARWRLCFARHCSGSLAVMYECVCALFLFVELRLQTVAHGIEARSRREPVDACMTRSSRTRAVGSLRGSRSAVLQEGAHHGKGRRGGGRWLTHSSLDALLPLCCRFRLGLRPVIVCFSEGRCSIAAGGGMVHRVGASLRVHRGCLRSLTRGDLGPCADTLDSLQCSSISQQPH